MAQASDDTRGALAAERDAEDAAGAAAKFFPIKKLPNDLLVSVFMAIENPTWVRHTIPFVCREWREIYRSKGASPLHETLEFDVEEEVERAKDSERLRRLADTTQEFDPYSPVLHASRVISWARRRAGSVRKLDLSKLDLSREEARKAFSAAHLGRLVAVVGPSLTDIWVSPDSCSLCKRPFWRSVRTSVAPFGRLRRFFVEGVDCAVSESDVEPLGQLSGSLEELWLNTAHHSENEGLPHFPESFCALKELRSLVLIGHAQITAIPAGISSLKKLKALDIHCCGLSSLPKGLGELSGLEWLDLQGNPNLGTTLPSDEAFPAALGGMKSLRVLNLVACGLRAVPSFVCELESLKSLYLSDNSYLSSLPKELGELSRLEALNLTGNETLGTAAEAFPAALGRMKSLRDLNLERCGLRTVPSFVCEQKSLERLDLSRNSLSSLPKELGELSGLTKLDLWGNRELGLAPEAEAFPAELGNMKSLRELSLRFCGLRAVPAFVGGLKSLESLDLSNNSDMQIDAPLDFLIEGCPRLREVTLEKGWRRVPWTPESLAHLEAFEAALRAKNPDARVEYNSEDE